MIARRFHLRANQVLLAAPTCARRGLNWQGRHQQHDGAANSVPQSPYSASLGANHGHPHSSAPTSSGAAYVHRTRFPALDLVAPASKYPVDDPRISADLGMAAQVSGPTDRLDFPCSLARWSYCVEKAKVYMVRMPVLALPGTTPQTATSQRDVVVTADVGTMSCLRLTPYHVASLLAAIELRPCFPKSSASSHSSMLAPPAAAGGWDERPCSTVITHSDDIEGGGTMTTVTISLHSKQFQMFVEAKHATPREAAEHSAPPMMPSVSIRGVVVDDSLLFWHMWGFDRDEHRDALAALEDGDSFPRLRTWDSLDFSPEQVGKLHTLLTRSLREGLGWGEFGGPPYSTANQNRRGRGGQSAWDPTRDGSLREAAAAAAAAPGSGKGGTSQMIDGDGAIPSTEHHKTR